MCHISKYTPIYIAPEDRKALDAIEAPTWPAALQAYLSDLGGDVRDLTGKASAPDSKVARRLAAGRLAAVVRHRHGVLRSRRHAVQAPGAAGLPCVCARSRCAVRRPKKYGGGGIACFLLVMMGMLFAVHPVQIFEAVTGLVVFVFFLWLLFQIVTSCPGLIKGCALATVIIGVLISLTGVGAVIGIPMI